MKIIHIETKPYSPEILLAGANIAPAANLKDPVKIKEDIEKRRQKYVQDAYLSENTAQIAAVGYRDFLSSKTEILIDEDESQLIKRMCEVVKNSDTVSFRGTKFVYPFLMRRGLRYDINFTQIFYNKLTGKLREEIHTDIARVWACGSLSHPENIQEIASVVNVDVGCLSSNLKFYQLLEQNTVLAKDYMEQMLETIEKIYRKIV